MHLHFIQPHKIYIYVPQSFKVTPFWHRLLWWPHPPPGNNWAGIKNICQIKNEVGVKSFRAGPQTWQTLIIFSLRNSLVHTLSLPPSVPSIWCIILFGSTMLIVLNTWPTESRRDQNRFHLSSIACDLLKRFSQLETETSYLAQVEVIYFSMSMFNRGSWVIPK